MVYSLDKARQSCKKYFLNGGGPRESAVIKNSTFDKTQLKFKIQIQIPKLLFNNRESMRRNGDTEKCSILVLTAADGDVRSDKANPIPKRRLVKHI